MLEVSNEPNFRQRSRAPITTGTSVIGIKYKDGVIIAADTLGSYGSLARFSNCNRVKRVNDSTILGCGGDFADFQYLSSMIEQKIISEECLNDGFSLKPKSLHCWLTRFLYNRRSKINPLWNTYIVGGIQDGAPFLGEVDKLGGSYEDNTLATGFGAYLARPLLEEAYKKNSQMTEEEAKALIIQCLSVLFFRDARAFNKYEFAIVNSSGTKVEGPFVLKPSWDKILSQKY